MAGSVNKVILVGNIGRDPEIRTLNNGERVANLSLATSEQWRDKASGERKERTEWHRIVVFNDSLVGIIERYVKKGSTLYIEGSLQTRKWTDQNGQEKYSTEIVLQRFNGNLTLLGGRPDGGGSSQSSGGYDSYEDSYGGAPASSGPKASGSGPAQKFDLDDEIPF